MWKELALTVRALRRSPLFTTAAVLSLALGIGANTAIFSMLNQVVLRSLPVRDPQSLVLLHTTYNSPGNSSSDNSEAVFSNPMYRKLRTRDQAFSGLIARMSGSARFSTGGATEPASAEMVSGNFFQVLGVGAAMGRVIVPSDDGAAGANPVIVLSHAFWSSHFGNKASILNQTVAINGFPMVVVGVTEPGFFGIMPGSPPDFYVPISMQKQILTTVDMLEDPKSRWLNLMGRLTPGMALQKAQAASDVAYRAALEEQMPALGGFHTEKGRNEYLNHRAELRPALHGVGNLRERWQTPLVALMVLVGLVLTIACFNVASLMLARAAGRRREIAIRVALGAGRGVLVKQLLLEGFVVAMTGAALGLLVARWCAATLIAVLPQGYDKWMDSGISLPMLGFTFGVAAICGLLFGLAPALDGASGNVAASLKELSQSVASGGNAGFRKALVVGQLALSLLLVSGAGLFSGSLNNLLNLNLGYRTQRVTTFAVNATLSRRDVATANAFYEDLQTRLERIPGVTAVAAGADGPFSGGTRAGNMTVEGYTAAPNEMVGSNEVTAGPGFFHALGIPLRVGRDFSDRDRAGAQKVVVVNEAFARKYFANRNATGMHIMFGSSDHPVLDKEIIGVSADIRNEVRTEPVPTVYITYLQWDRPTRLTYYVRASGDQTHLGTDIRRALREADPNIPVGTIKPLDIRIRETLYTDRLIAMLSTAFGVLATLLAAIGLYGVIAYAVTRRTPEIGIRMALGAVPANVLRLILKEAAAMAGIGIAIGLGAALALSKFVQSQLYGMQANDPRVYAAAAGALAAVVLFAAAFPAIRAARIDPVRALKYE